MEQHDSVKLIVRAIAPGVTVGKARAKKVNVDVKNMSLSSQFHSSISSPFSKKKNKKRDIFNLICANNCHVFVDGVIWITRQSILSSKKQGQVV